MADTQEYKCSTCKCHRAESAFKVNRKGNRLKTCLGCNERKRKTPAKADLADTNKADLADTNKADPPSPRIDLCEGSAGECERIIVTLSGSDTNRRAQHDWTFEMIRQSFKGELIYVGVPQ